MLSNAVAKFEDYSANAFDSIKPFLPDNDTLMQGAILFAVIIVLLIIIISVYYTKKKQNIITINSADVRGGSKSLKGFKTTGVITYNIWFFCPEWSSIKEKQIINHKNYLKVYLGKTDNTLHIQPRFSTYQTADDIEIKQRIDIKNISLQSWNFLTVSIRSGKIIDVYYNGKLVISRVTTLDKPINYPSSPSILDFGSNVAKVAYDRGIIFGCITMANDIGPTTIQQIYAKGPYYCQGATGGTITNSLATLGKFSAEILPKGQYVWQNDEPEIQTTPAQYNKPQYNDMNSEELLQALKDKIDVSQQV